MKQGNYLCSTTAAMLVSLAAGGSCCCLLPSQSLASGEIKESAMSPGCWNMDLLLMPEAVAFSGVMPIITLQIYRDM